MVDAEMKKGDRVRVRAIDNPMVNGHHKSPGFKGTLVRIYTDHRDREIAEVREDSSHGSYVVLAERVSLMGRKRLGAIAYPDDYKGPKTRRAPTPRDPSAPAPGARPCACTCGGTTGGGNFLPGHDARLVSMVLRGVAKPSALADFPKLLAKYQAKKAAVKKK